MRKTALSATHRTREGAPTRSMNRTSFAAKLAAFTGATVLAAGLSLAGAGSALAAAHPGGPAGARAASAAPQAAGHRLSAPAVTPAVRAKLAGASSICYDAHVQNIGWQGWVCNGAVAGTVGLSLRMEALAIVTSNFGGICADAHVQNIGWQGWECVGDGQEAVVGTTGLSLRMEALALADNDGGLPGTGNTICANAHVQNIGWQGWSCGSPIIVGTTGQSLRMEAVEILI